jgi:hypothetical protein
MSRRMGSASGAKACESWSSAIWTDNPAP